eukprot:2921620-Amphidinium_carterae.1
MFCWSSTTPTGDREVFTETPEHSRYRHIPPQLLHNCGSNMDMQSTRMRKILALHGARGPLASRSKAGFLGGRPVFAILQQSRNPKDLPTEIDGEFSNQRGHKNA